MTFLLEKQCLLFGLGILPWNKGVARRLVDTSNPPSTSNDLYFQSVTAGLNHRVDSRAWKIAVSTGKIYIFSFVASGVYL